MQQLGPYISSFGLDRQGLGDAKAAYWNLATAALYEEAIRRGEGKLARNGALVVLTGQHTGRSANDKFIVKEPTSDENIWWGEVNRPISAEHAAGLKTKVLAHLGGRELFVQDCYAGADPRHRLPVRVVTEIAWHSLFARNMFIVPPSEDLAVFEPKFTVLNAPSLFADPDEDGTRSGTFIVVDFGQRLVLIGGTSYAGEIKKSVFTLLNYLLPDAGALPMHSSVNVGDSGDSAVFFGLSGTGKTTLSASPDRILVGDDEHGWTDQGVFNFEGGCYAKVIRLSAEAEPEIFATTERFGTILENVVMDDVRRTLDLDDATYTENTRGSYPLEFISNASSTGMAGHPKTVVMLTADAFGVLPPISRLTSDQAMYHFLSGYTAKVAGTEKGLGKEPQATFSTCFGAPFMPRHPSVYARMLGDMIARHKTDCWLVNTGWSGGGYGTGERMAIAHTRALLKAALDGSLAAAPVSVDRSFGLAVPQACADVPDSVLNPRDTWSDKTAYDTVARDLVSKFHDNFDKFAPYVSENIKAAAPTIAA